MAEKTITIKREEYARLKKKEQIDTELLDKLVSGINDIREGRIKRIL